jgi:putative membrane protein
VSAAGAILPIELSDEAFQALHPYLPLSWVVEALRVALFDAHDGVYEPALAVVLGTGLGALLLGTAAGRWTPVPEDRLRPPLDLD